MQCADAGILDQVAIIQSGGPERLAQMPAGLVTAKDAIAKYWGSKNSPCAERIADRESNFDPTAVNRSSGTVGLFQIHPTHATWIRNTYGYEMSELTDPYKNAKVAAGLSAEAYRYYGDGWQPWRIGGKVIRGGGCPA